MSQIPKPKINFLEYLGIDILHQICSLLSERTIDIDQWGRKGNPERKSLPDLIALSSTNKTMRRLSEPMLFDELTVIKSRGRSVSWEEAAEKLETLNRDALRILRFVKTFTFIIPNGYNIPLGALIPTIPLLLAISLSHLSALQTITFDISEEAALYFPLFSDVFQAQSIVLPLVHTIVLGVSSEFLLASCPNVRSVHMITTFNALHGSKGHAIGWNLIEAVMKAGTVTHLKYAGGWTVKMARALAANPTNPLTTLAELTPRHDVRVQDLLEALSPLQHLQAIELADLTQLNMGYYPPRCGNAYMGAGGSALRQAVKLQRKELEAQVLKMVEAAFREGRTLRKVRIGGDYARFERREVGSELEEEGWWREGMWIRERRHDDEVVVEEEAEADADDGDGDGDDNDDDEMMRRRTASRHLMRRFRRA